MCCLDVVWMVISPRSAHPLWFFVVWYYIVVVREWFFAYGTDSVLFDDLALQQLFHFGR
jgi:hypothetical protein